MVIPKIATKYLAYFFVIPLILLTYTINSFAADNAIYVGISRQSGLYNQLDTVSNNMANANTSGFKQKNVMFNEYKHLNTRYGKRTLSYGQDYAGVNDFSQGPLKSTAKQLDVAINGEGFFVVKAPFGDAYTRNGNFTISADGRLTNAEGYSILSIGGDITFGEEDQEIQISDEGMVTSRINGAWENRGQLRVVKFKNLLNMEMVASSLFINKKEEPTVATAFEDFVLAQGMLEDSNISAISETAEMMKVNRNATSIASLVADNHRLQLKSIDVLLGGGN
ncbi:MAG: flagellar hook-basal body complex protein [Alphaproteobacteria bacterium]|jgi:flagellar basal-body rod protein FlgF